MSCITELLKLKGDKPILMIKKDQGVCIEGGGKYKGYEYLITFTDMGTRCGYVAIPPEHKGNEWSTIGEPDISCHGGVTFLDDDHYAKRLLGDHPCKDKWIGFDCAHGGDRFDVETAEKYFGADNPMVEFRKTNWELGRWGRHQEERSYSYVEQNCISIIEQLIEMEKAA